MSKHTIDSTVHPPFDHSVHVLEMTNQMLFLCEQMMVSHPPGPPQCPAVLNHLTIVLMEWFELSMNHTAMEMAIQLLEQSLELCPPGHPDRTSSLTNLANAIWTRFKQSGSSADLDRAVLLNKQVLKLCPPGHPNCTLSLNNITNVIWTWFEQSGSHADLERAVQLHEQALELRPPNHPDHALSLNNLANVVTGRFEQWGSSADLERAMLLHEQALELDPPSHPNRASSLGNLAVAVQRRFKRSGSHADLERAVLLHGQALELRPPGHPDRAISHITFAKVVLARFKESGSSTDLEQALHLCHQGLDTTPDTESPRTDLFATLGTVHVAAFLSSGKPSNLEQALDAFSQGAQFPFAPLSSRFQAAAIWVLYAITFNQHESAIAACKIAIALLPQLLWLELDLPSRLAAVKRAAGFACDGAACAVHESKLSEAVELLEGGRGVFWTHTLQLRVPHTDLPPPFAQKLTNLSHALRAATLQDSSSKEPLSAKRLAAENVRRRELVDGWSQTLKQIRETTGFEQFFLPQPFKELAEAAQDGPIIILNASRLLDCDSVVIKSPHLPPEHVALPSMSFEKLEQLVAGLKRTLRGTARYMELAIQNPGPDFPDILEELWTSVAKPIVEFLGLERSDNPKRLWWCPTNLFTFMPVHAAGIYHAKKTISMSDYAISSYIPTLDALITARSHAAPTKVNKVLVVINPGTVGPGHLPCTVEERKSIQGVVPAAAFLPLSDPVLSQSANDGLDATVENVLSRLPEASIVHFACHGTQNKDPLKSALHLRDGPLTLDRIIHGDLSNASIAFLSACHSATGDEEQPDEVVHLGAAMLAAGYQSVIATMWSMGDKDGPVVAEEIYKKLFSPRPDPHRAAYALHAAVRKLRETGADFAAWVPFIHLGV